MAAMLPHERLERFSFSDFAGARKEALVDRYEETLPHCKNVFHTVITCFTTTYTEYEYRSLVDHQLKCTCNELCLCCCCCLCQWWQSQWLLGLLSLCRHSLSALESSASAGKCQTNQPCHCQTISGLYIALEWLNPCNYSYPSLASTLHSFIWSVCALMNFCTSAGLKSFAS